MRKTLLILSLLLGAGPARAARLERVEELGPVRIHGKAAMMLGPWTARSLEFDKPVALRSLRVELRDGSGRPVRDLSNLCHVTFSYSRSLPSDEPWQIATVDATTPRFAFPDGYGFILVPGQRYALNAMAYSDSAAVDRELRFVVVLELEDDPAGAGIRPLRLAQVGIRAKDAGLPGYTGPHDWLVPPGRHEYAHEGPAPFSGRLFVIAPHLHPHVAGYRLEEPGGRRLLDVKIAGKTAGGLARPGDTVWADPAGVPVDAGKRYRWTVVYDNTTDHPIPVMASFLSFYAP